jgi:hypothetical protein
MYRRDVIEVLLTVGGFVVVLVAGLLVVLAFLSAIARVLRCVQPEHRRMEPGQVWLNLIPVFNFIWATVTVERVAESLRGEFAARGMHGPDERYGRRTGLTMLVLLLIVIPPVVAVVSYPLALGYAIAYWRHMNRYAERLKPGNYSPPPTDEGW